ncbi:putative leucine-rich repeat domain superfamily [Helianthus anomalus]
MDSPGGRHFTTIQPPLQLPYLQSIHLSGLKEVSHVWKCNWNKFIIPQHQPLQFPFQNLTSIYLNNCHKIRHLFSPLMAKYLSNLKELDINGADGMEEVICRRDDEIEENTSTSYHQDTVFFPHLDTIELASLPCLKSVDGDTRCRSDKFSSNTLRDGFQSGQVMGACWSLCQSPRKMYISHCDALSSLIPWYAAGQMRRLEALVITNCQMLMEVFESKSSANNVDEGGAHGGACTTLTRPTLKNITTVVALAPQLSNLKTVYITKCDLLSHIFTFSTLESLHQLKYLRVTKCPAIQVIVKRENETSTKVVVFPRLETLELKHLPSLKGFFLGMNGFQWPSLDNVLIDNCPELMMFTSGQSTTPKLKYIQTSFGKYSPECGLNFHEAIDQVHFLYQATMHHLLNEHFIIKFSFP